MTLLEKYENLSKQLDKLYNKIPVLEHKIETDLNLVDAAKIELANIQLIIHKLEDDIDSLIKELEAKGYHI
jgi:peptidoglycan hydrolase CwlO-like protein